MHQHADVFVGIDVAKSRNAIAIADCERGGEIRYFGEVDASQGAMRHVVQRICDKHGRAHFCYEAGPTGYGFYRLITAMGYACDVVVPSLIPMKPGDRVKTNRRDAICLAELLRAGELTSVWVPDEVHEAMRDLVRARAATDETQRVHRQQVGAFMLKHVRIFPRKTAWAHVWTTPAAQELLISDEHRSGASMCSACSRSTVWLLALMKSAGRLPNHVIALEAL